MIKTQGIHHVSMMSRSAKTNLNFYSNILGLNLIKATVNHDDPLMIHLYYSTVDKGPGTILTFFITPDGRPGVIGNSMVSAIGLKISRNAMSFFEGRLVEAGYSTMREVKSGKQRLLFADPDGLPLTLVEDESSPESNAPQIVGIDHAQLIYGDIRKPKDFLTEYLGYDVVSETSDGAWMRAADSEIGQFLELRQLPHRGRGLYGNGTVHHIAFRVPSLEDQEPFRADVLHAKLSPSPVINRNYFQSIYYREPGGVLYEMATDGPGFDYDEPKDALGQVFVLPPWLESRRAEIEEAVALRSWFPYAQNEVQA